MAAVAPLLPRGEFSEYLVEFIEEVGGIYFRSIRLAKAGMFVPQHEHDHDHATFCGNGAARAWADNEWIGDVEQGRAIEIKAGRHHTFMALEDNTLLTCIHDLSSALSLKERGL